MGKKHLSRDRESQYGLIYIAHYSEDKPDIFKVGQTTQPIKKRMKELASTGVRGEYSERAYFYVSDVDAAEDACHKALRRHHVKKEFFQISYAELLPIVQEIVAKFPIMSYWTPPENGGTGSESAEYVRVGILAKIIQDIQKCKSPDHSTLLRRARHKGLNARSVKTKLDMLIQKGLVRVEKQRTGRGKFKRIYHWVPSQT